MIKAVGRKGDGTPLVILGLSGENMTRLMADEPIAVDLASMGLPRTQIVIVGGRTEDAIAEKLKEIGLLTPDATAGQPG